MVKRIEICANSAESCLAAARAGAYRVELCAGIPEGGTTPSIGEVLTAIDLTKDYGLRVYPIIRPRGGDFLYSDIETRAMTCDIRTMASLGVDGIVFGCLMSDGKIDVEKCSEMIQCAKNINPEIAIACHRAFDMTPDPFDALETLISLGFERVLTSGHCNKAIENTALIAELVRRADGRISIMPGSGVRLENIEQIAYETGAYEFHTSARHTLESKMEYRKESISMGGTVTIEEYSREVSSEEYIRKIINKL